ncbi:hypothetical protein DH2020_008104 [Rehmannia glutinosa]|uniref:E3 ubiquitin-protein ligase RMA n=1 Tax=Rehmannia glutinosa TaxID=99300 RepID=A0ABR0U029_REHGL
MHPPSPSCSSSTNNNSDAANFECNICLDLAQDPIVTLCGHLFCWPCLYKWLHIHSRSQECPVCKALIEEEKLVPLYGRGKNSTDPRSKSIPGMEIPHRPTGQRPETAPPPNPNANANAFAQQGYGFMGGFGPFGGFAPMATARFGPGFPYGYSNTFHGGHAQEHPHRGNQQQQADSTLKLLLLVIGVSVLLTLIWS